MNWDDHKKLDEAVFASFKPKDTANRYASACGVYQALMLDLPETQENAEWLARNLVTLANMKKGLDQ